MTMTRNFLLPLALFLAGALAQPAHGSDSVTNAAQPAAGTSSSAVLDPTYGLGSWIWAAETYDRQTCRFWRSFEVPSSAVVVRALLRITVDNGYTLFLDGREVGKGSDWRAVSEYDLTLLLVPGTHVLGVQAFNDGDKAGVIAGLRVALADGEVIGVGSDESWRVVPQTERNWQTATRARPSWPKATVVGTVGSPPWWSRPLSISKAPRERPLLVHFWQTGWFLITLLTLCALALALSMRLAAQLAVQTRAQKLVERERARIARDIHDELGSSLTQLVLQGEEAQTEFPEDSAARARLDQLCERARNVSQALEEVLWVVNSKHDTVRDFCSYVCKYAQSFLSPTPIRCRLDVQPEMPSSELDLPVRRGLFLAVKEALNNAAKHSQATELFLRISCEDDKLVVVVEDNGRGFDASLLTGERNGLSNMQQRLAEMGGACQVFSEPGAGCRVEFKMPLARIAARATPWWRQLFQRQPRSGPAGGLEPRVSAAESQHCSKT